MTRSLPLVSLALGTVLLGTGALAGCSGAAATLDAGGDAVVARDDASVDAAVGSDGGMGGSLSAYCRPLALDLCTAASSCGCEVVLPGVGLDVEACTARLEAECVTAWSPFLEAGARVDLEAAAGCAALIESSTLECDAPSGVAAFGLCPPFVIDPAALGEACRTPYCAGGEGYCDTSAGATGSCVARGASGAPCSDMFFCATGLVCNGGVCTTLLGDGATGCTTDLECRPPLRCIEGACSRLRAAEQPCTETRECARGLGCVGSRCTAAAGTGCVETGCGNLELCAQPPACRTPLLAGERCNENVDCEASLYCEDASKTCIVRPAAGESCGNGVICAAGLGCESDGGGVCRTLGASGSACLFGEFGPFLCAPGLACIDGTCGPLPGEGQPCAGTDTCAAGLGCAFGPEGSLCVVPRGEGERCENRQACRADLHCGDEGTCVADVAIGAACDPTRDECGGACVPDASGGFVCLAPVAEGEACLADTDCSAGLTCLARESDARCIAAACLAL